MRSRSKISGVPLHPMDAELTAMNAQQLRIYAIADIHSPDSFRMAQLSPESYDLVLTLGDIDEGTRLHRLHESWNSVARCSREP